VDGDSIHEGIVSLLEHPRVQDPAPVGAGGQVAAERDGEANTTHKANPAGDTADFSDRSVGNLRVDYVLPSANLKVVESAVFWPAPGAPEAQLTAVSDHHPVWVELEL
jgi:endonuclease/exonuclease/phosphatase family metal-dependent hydrolase